MSSESRDLAASLAALEATSSSTHEAAELLDQALATLHAMSSGADEAADLLEQLASALTPRSQRDREHLTWADRPTGSAVPAVDPEARLRAAELRFKTLVEQIPAVTFMAVLGEGDNEVYVSPHIERMLGFTQEEWLENPFLWYRQLHPDDRKLWNEEFARGCRTGGPFRAECRFLARDGRPVWVHGEARVVKDSSGRPQFLQGVAFDISESKRAQEVILGEAVKRAKMEEELALARRLQTSILPRNPQVEGLEVAATMLCASEVGGDYYDVLPFPGGAWLGIGDVAGHGLDAGLVMLMVQSATAALVRAHPTAAPHELLAQLNGVLYDNIRRRLGGDHHVTFELIRYTRDGLFVHAGAHEDMIVLRKNARRAEQVPTLGAWLGGAADISKVCQDGRLQLARGDLLVLYTDGITEARDPRGRLFDVQRLCSTIEDLRERPAEEIVKGIIDGVQSWTRVQDDDMSVVVTRYHGR